MISADTIAQICLSFPETTESPHFEKTSFRVKKKIFATLDSSKSHLVVKLSDIDQSVFSNLFPEIVYPVPGGWGKKGWTLVEIAHFENEDAMRDILKTAYKEVAPGKLKEAVT